MKVEFFKNANNIMKRILIGKTGDAIQRKLFFLGQNGYSYVPTYSVITYSTFGNCE